VLRGICKLRQVGDKAKRFGAAEISFALSRRPKYLELSRLEIPLTSEFADMKRLDWPSKVCYL
jgi:hypothetical protein